MIVDIDSTFLFKVTQLEYFYLERDLLKKNITFRYS